LYYTASGIITLLGGLPVHRLRAEQTLLFARTVLQPNIFFISNASITGHKHLIISLPPSTTAKVKVYLMSKHLNMGNDLKHTVCLCDAEVCVAIIFYSDILLLSYE